MFLWRLSLTGGIPKVVRTLLRSLDPDLFDLHVCTARPLLAEDRLDTLSPHIRFTTLGISRHESPVRKLRAALELSSLIRTSDPDVVHAHSGTAWYLAPWLLTAGRTTPTILEVHDSPQSGRVSRLNNAVEGFLLRRPTALPLTHSSSVRTDLAAAARIAIGRITTIPIGIEVAAFANRSSRSRWRDGVGIGTDEAAVTYIARLVKSKDPNLFLQVAAEVVRQRQGCIFLLVGDGPEAAALTEEAAHIGLGSRLLILRDVPDVAEVLAATDIFVSTSQYEGFGIAVLEAMAAGLPVVSTDAGGVKDLLVPGDSGIITPQGDKERLVESVIELLDDPSFRARMGRRARERAQSIFDISSMVGSYQDLYVSAARRRPRRHDT